MKIFLNRNWLRLLGIVMLLVAVFAYFSGSYSLPYAFYQLMCWIVVIESLMIAWNEYKNGKLPLMWLFVLVAIVFNPFAPISLSTLAWQYADLVVALLFVLSFFFFGDKKDRLKLKVSFLNKIFRKKE